MSTALPGGPVFGRATRIIKGHEEINIRSPLPPKVDIKGGRGGWWRELDEERRKDMFYSRGTYPRVREEA